jgi:hypothetical protein
MVFRSVAVDFSPREWECMNLEQRNLCTDMMMKNYSNLPSEGLSTYRPLVFSLLEKGRSPAGFCRMKQNNFPRSHSTGTIFLKNFLIVSVNKSGSFSKKR